MSRKSSNYLLGWWNWTVFIRFMSWVVILMLFLHLYLFWSYKRLSCQLNSFWKLQSHSINAQLFTEKRCHCLKFISNQEGACTRVYKTKNYDVIFFHEPTVPLYISGLRLFWYTLYSYFTTIVRSPCIVRSWMINTVKPPVRDTRYNFII